VLLLPMLLLKPVDQLPGVTVGLLDPSLSQMA